jgi:hypothetical protein
MRKFLILGFVAFFGSAGPGRADDGLPSEAAGEPGEVRLSVREWFQDYSSLLGMSLAEAFETFGLPRQVSPVRGEEPWQDDVVFEYENGLSLFWYRDRVWQVRFGPGFRGSFSRFIMGSSRQDVLSALGEPLHREDDWFLYHFAGQGYPLRLRLFFGEEGLEDAYLYRGDF